MYVWLTFNVDAHMFCFADDIVILYQDKNEEQLTKNLI